jgi:hypothetical protein
MDLFKIVTFVHDKGVRISEPVALVLKCFGMENIMDLMPGDLETDDTHPSNRIIS